jgi:hypothetical protein
VKNLYYINGNAIVASSLQEALIINKEAQQVAVAS